jgi:phytoene synthase
LVALSGSGPCPSSGERELASSYELCRRLHRRHGRTYYLATRLLPAGKRRHVHALYGFTRYADDIVDEMSDRPVPVRAARLGAWHRSFLAGLDGEPVDEPILPAVLDTIATYELDRSDFASFLRSMTDDLTVATYDTYDDLLEYMEGSAAVIGTMMLPILGPPDPVAAREPARQLGLAFQLTNFIRDVAEDLDRDRIYLPLADLARFGLSPDDLRKRVDTPATRQLISFEVGRAREHYRQAAPGIAMLPPASQACIRTAYRLYGGILDEVVRAGYRVMGSRATVPTPRRLAVAASSLFTRPGRPVPLPAA